MTDDFAGLDNEGLGIDGLDNGRLNIDGLDIDGLDIVGLENDGRMLKLGHVKSLGYVPEIAKNALKGICLELTDSFK